MGLIRFVFILLLVVGGYWLWKKLTSPAANSEPGPQSQRMVQCRHCSVFLPQQQAVKKSGQWYCCDEHANLGQ